MTAPQDIPDLSELIQRGPLALCSLQDIAGVFGADSSSDLPAQWTARIPYIMAKLCRLFRLEAGREFTPGTSTIQLLSLNGKVPLPDGLGKDGTVDEVALPNGKVLDPQDYSVLNNKLIIKRHTILGHETPGTGDPFEVTYTHNEPVPWDVRATIASDVGRYLTVDPQSAVAQSTFLSSEGYHQRIAAWVADVVKLTPDDKELAHYYRPFRAMPIVHKIHAYHEGYTDWSQWQWGWGGVTLW